MLPNSNIAFKKNSNLNGNSEKYFLNNSFINIAINSKLNMLNIKIPVAVCIKIPVIKWNGTSKIKAGNIPK